MRIAFFTDHFRPEPSAPAAHVYERCKLWSEWGHQVTVITSAPNFPEGKVYDGYKNRLLTIEIMDGIKVLRVKTFIVPNEGFFLRTLDYMSYTVSASILTLLEPKPDVVVSTSPHLFVPLAGVIYSSMKAVPHVFEIRDLWPASVVSTTGMRRGFTYRLLEKIELGLYEKSNRIIAFTSMFKRDIVERGVPEEKVDVVINGANLELFSPVEKDAEVLDTFHLHDRFIIGYLGTIGLASGLDNVIFAAELLKDTPIIFFLVGVGAIMEKLKRLTREKDLYNVVFAGRQLKEDMPRFWSVCDVGLVHLRDDSVYTTVVPSKIFESMSTGTPILYVVPEGEGSSIVRKHNCGLIVPPERPDELARSALKLMNDHVLREKLGRNALEASPLYSRQRQAEGSLNSLIKACQS
ncbi:MAG: glycosyltransferase family 4 protein [Thermodesulfobacteriota bacterium]|nr:glycosyltransferase family 4 protein [Thermodesulfobacteriota bacterium]